MTGDCRSCEQIPSHGGGSFLRRLIGIFLLLSLLLLAPLDAGAHGAGINAVLSTDPVNLTPGQPALISVGLFDVYNSPIPAAGVRVRVEQDERPGQPTAELRESAPGTYSGTVTVAAPGFVVLRVEATLPDGLWSGPLPVETGPAGLKVSEMGIELLHQDATMPAPSSGTLPGTPPGTPRRNDFWGGTIAVVVLGLAAIMWGKHHARRK
jgi:hypothetical protein